MTLLAVLLATAFLLIAALHVYWGFGGQWAGSAAIPKRTDGTPVFAPGIGGCFVVAGGLAAFAYICLLHVALAPNLPPQIPWPTRGILFGMAGIFALRAVGDFRYVGFFRRVVGTDFAALDRKLYTPLCAGLAIALVLLARQ